MSLKDKLKPSTTKAKADEPAKLEGASTPTKSGVDLSESLQAPEVDVEATRPKPVEQTPQAAVESKPYADVSEIIAAGDLTSLNQRQNLARLRFQVANGILLKVEEVKAIHPDGALDLITQDFQFNTPTGSRGGASGGNQPNFYAKARRDDFSRDAGTYRVLV